MGVTKNLVLGGSGAIGSALCQHLISKNETVINLDLKEGFDLRTESLHDYKNVDYVWFLAWDVGGAKYMNEKKNQLGILRNNTLICQNVFSFLEETGIPFLFTSSQLAADDNTYGMTKLLGEYWSKLLKESQVARFWNVYGWETPGVRSHVIPDLVMQAITKKEISLFTSGEEQRQFIYMEDCVKNLYIARELKIKNIHLTNGEWIKIKDIAHIIGDLFNVPVHFGIEKGYEKKIDPDSSYADFKWDTSIEKGIQMIAREARYYLNIKI